MNVLNGSRLKVVSSFLAGWLFGAFLVLRGFSAEGGEGALMSVTRGADGLEIEFAGVLQSADSLAGPWADEAGPSPMKVAPVGARYYRIKRFELPAAARFTVDLEAGTVGVAPMGERPRGAGNGFRAAAVFAGSTIGFESDVVLDEPGNPGRKVLSVALVNQSGERVGEDVHGGAAGIKVILGEPRNLSAPSDLRLQAMVSTIAGAGFFGATDGPALLSTFVSPTGVTRGPDGAIYICDGNRIRKLTGNRVFTVAGSGTAASVDGIGTAASFNFPRAIAYSAALNGLVVVEQTGRRVRLVTLDGTVTTIAGTGAAGGVNGAGNVATFNDPTAVAVDGAGAIYVGEYPGQRIRKVTLTGPNPRVASSYLVETWAGSGVAGTADGVGTAAQFSLILGLAAEQNGTLYVTDSVKVRRVSTAREVVSIAGGPTPGAVDGNGIVARFKGLYGITLLNGSIVVSEFQGQTLRMLILAPGGTVQNAADWQVRTLAGTGIAGGTDGRGDVAQFNSPFGITGDGAGNVIVADNVNRKLRRVSPAAGYFSLGTPVATSVTEPVQLSNADSFFPLTRVSATRTSVTIAQPVIEYDEILLPGETSAPRNWAFEVPDGVYGFEFEVTVVAPTETKVPLTVVTNSGPPGVGSPDVLVSTVSGTGLGGHINSPVIAARFNSANGIAVDREGNIYVADSNNHAIRRIGTNGMVTTIAGLPGAGAGSGDGSGSVASFNGPRGVTVSADGRTLYVTDSSNHTIRRLNNFFGSDPALPNSWTVATIAGLTGSGTYAEGNGSVARFNFPVGIVWTPGDTVFVSEFSGNRVRRLQPAGANLQVATSWQVSLVAGSSVSPVGTAGSTDGFGTSARFDLPAHIAADQMGNLYVADVNNSRIRKIDPNTDVSTLAGSTFGYADGTGTSAQFGQPNGVTVDSAGYVYVADTSFHRIRRISPAGVVTTIAGTGDTFPGDLDGTGDVARFYFPLGITVDGGGALYVISGGTYGFIGGGGVTSPGLRVRKIQRILR